MTWTGLDARCIVISIMNLLRSKKVFVLLAALLLLAAFGLALLHTHADDGHDGCPVCRLVQVFGLLFAFAVIALMGDQAKARKFLPVSCFSFQPLFLTSKLRDRSPPFRK